MAGNDDRRPARDISRSNRRIQELEERASFLTKEVGKLKEIVGSKDATVADLVKLIDKRVQVLDSLGGRHLGVLKWISNWNLGLLIEHTSDVTIMFKGNLVMVTPMGESKNEH